MKASIIFLLLCLNISVYSLPKVLLLYNGSVNSVNGLIERLNDTGKLDTIVPYHITNNSENLDPLSNFDAILTAFSVGVDLSQDPTDLSRLGDNITEAVSQGRLGFVNTVRGNTDNILPNTDLIRLIAPTGTEEVAVDFIEATTHPIFFGVTLVSYTSCKQAGNNVTSGRVLSSYNTTGNPAIIIEGKVIELALWPFDPATYGPSEVPLLIANAIQAVVYTECNYTIELNDVAVINCTHELGDYRDLVESSCPGSMHVTQIPPTGTNLGVGLHNITFIIQQHDLTTSITRILRVLNENPIYFENCNEPISIPLNVLNCTAALSDSVLFGNHLLPRVECGGFTLTTHIPPVLSIHGATGLVTITDNAGSTSSCMVTIVTTGESIRINCSSSTQIQLNENCSANLRDVINTLYYLDGGLCTSPQVSASWDLLHGVTDAFPINLTVFDSTQPDNYDQCEIAVSTVDYIAPSVICPPFDNFTVNGILTESGLCDLNIQSFIPDTIASDNCKIMHIEQVPIGNYSAPNDERIEVTITAYDSYSSGSCTFSIVAFCNSENSGRVRTTTGEGHEDLSTTGSTTNAVVTTTGLLSTTSVLTTEEEVDDETDRPLDAATTAAIAASTTGGSLLIAAIGAAFYVRRKKKQKKRPSDNLISSVEMNNYSSSSIIDESSISKLKLTDITIEGTIGSGNFGDVFKGIWMGTTQVALKKLKGDQVSQFVKEASILSQLNHPNIVRFLGIFQDKEDYYIATEFIAGGSLVNALQSENKWNLDSLLLIARDACSGLKFLHSNNVIHGDLSCRNLLIENDSIPYTIPINIVSSPFHVKLCDFGMAKILSSSQNEYTRDNNSIPVRWSSLETNLYGKFSTSSDIWSFGIVLWEIFTLGKIPYAGMSNVEVIEQIKAGYRLSQPELCPEGLYKLMLRMWSENPQDRPTAQEVYDAIDTTFKTKK